MEQSLNDELKSFLQECYRRELDGEEPCTEQLIHAAPELIVNQLVELRMHVFRTNERKVAYFITEKGKERLKEV